MLHVGASGQWVELEDQSTILNLTIYRLQVCATATCSVISTGNRKL